MTGLSWDPHLQLSPGPGCLKCGPCDPGRRDIRKTFVLPQGVQGGHIPLIRLKSGVSLEEGSLSGRGLCIPGQVFGHAQLCESKQGVGLTRSRGAGVDHCGRSLSSFLRCCRPPALWTPPHSQETFLALWNPSHSLPSPRVFSHISSVRQSTVILPVLVFICYCSFVQAAGSPFFGSVTCLE